jgi:hypothetical protein
VLVEPGVLKSDAHADGRIARPTAWANYCVQLTAGADGWRSRVSASARRS